MLIVSHVSLLPSCLYNGSNIYTKTFTSRFFFNSSFFFFLSCLIFSYFVWLQGKRTASMMMSIIPDSFKSIWFSSVYIFLSSLTDALNFFFMIFLFPNDFQCNKFIISCTLFVALEFFSLSFKRRINFTLAHHYLFSSFHSHN